jgi:hypothetical protein
MVQVTIPVRAVGVSKNKKKMVNTFGNCIFHVYGEQTPLNRLLSFFGTSRDLANIINCAKFYIDRSRGYGGVEVQKSHVIPIGKRSRP